jgi:cytoskeletal protein RodZ
MKDTKNYYEILEIPMEATQEEVHKSYVRAKNAYSGESIALYSLMSKDDCDQVLNQIEEAYTILSVADKRRDYDRIKGFNATAEHSTSNENFFQPAQQMASAGTPYAQPMHEDRSAHLSAAPTANYSHSGITTFNPNKVSDDELNRDFSINRNQMAESSKLSAKNRFSLNFHKDAQFEQDIENATEFNGDFLKKIREYKQVDIVRMSDMTKVSKTYIKYIEGDDFENLPAYAYTRGFVYQFAKCLKLNPDLVATSYMHHLKGLQNAKGRQSG